MPGIRDHESIVIEEFNGLWSRGSVDSVPLDHFITADNIQYFHSGFETRNPLNTYQTGATILDNIVRQYNYVMQTGQSILALVSGGHLYHIVGSGTVYGPILNLPAMEDFGFVSIAGRAYITPFASYPDNNNLWQEKGLQGEFVYVYSGNGGDARKIGGATPTNGGLLQPTAYNSFNDGVVTKGVHLIAISWGNGPLGPKVYPVVDAPGDKMIQVQNVPVGTGSRVVYMTKAMTEVQYHADQVGYTFYQIQEAFPDSYAGSVLINTPDENLTVAYAGNATPPFPTDNAMTAENTPGGHTDLGYHIIGVVYETDTGYLTAPGPESFAQTTFIKSTDSVTIRNIPIGPSIDHVVKRHLVSTKALPFFNGSEQQYQFFFIPNGEIDDTQGATITTKNVSYYDSDLVDDASHLSDNFAYMAAGVTLNTYHGRMVLVGEYDNPSVARISAPGEPESFSKVDGLITAPLDGNPLTNIQEFRDVMYLFKKTRTYAYSDNNDEPVTWMPEEVIDEAIGAPVHGIATVLDSGGVNIDFLLIADLSGLMMFNGVYARPELSWKIENYWFSLDRNEFRKIQLVNDSISKRIWITQPAPYQNRLLFADYGAGGLDPRGVKWARWPFDVTINSVALIETSKLIIGASSTNGIIGGLLWMRATPEAESVARFDNYYGSVSKQIPNPTVKTALLGD